MLMEKCGYLLVKEDNFLGKMYTRMSYELLHHVAFCFCDFVI